MEGRGEELSKGREKEGEGGRSRKMALIPALMSCFGQQELSKNYIFMSSKKAHFLVLFCRCVASALYATQWRF